MITTKPRVIPISDDGELGKIMPGEAFIEQYFPELLDKKPDATTDPIRPTPVPDPPVITPPAVIVPPVPAFSVSQLESLYVGTQRDTGNPMFLVKFPVYVNRFVDDKASLPDQIGFAVTDAEGKILRADGYTDRLLEDHSDGRLAKFSVCGGEIGIRLQPGVSLPEIPWTQGWGFNTPPDFVCPADYTEGNFPGQNGQLGRKFFAWKNYQEPAAKPAPMNLQIQGHYEPSGR